VNCELYRPDIQRLIDYQRVTELIEYQKAYHKTHDTFSFLGDIIVAELDDTFFVIDGLHRLEAIKYYVSMWFLK
jgi:hypothetical protein